MKPVVWVTRKRGEKTVSYYDLHEYLIILRVVESISDEAGEVEFNLYNPSAKFADLFQKGDEIEVRLGYEGQNITKVGTYVVDDLIWSFPPDTLTVSGLVVDVVKQQVRTIKSRVWENATLAQIVQQIAAEASLRAVTTGIEGIKFKHIEQREMNDLNFLYNLASSYDCRMQIKGGYLYFESRDQLAQRPAVATLTRDDERLSAYKFRWKAFATYKSAKIKYFDPEKKRYFELEEVDPSTDSEQVLVLTQEVESIEQAQRIAKAQLRRHNRREITADFTLFGDTSFEAGMNIAIKGFHPLLDGVYTVTKVVHQVSRQGFITSLGCERR